MQTKLLVLTICTLFLASLSQAQWTYQPAQIVLSNGSLLKGEIQYVESKFSPTKIVFSNADSKLVSYSPDDVQTFSVAGRRFVAASLEVQDRPHPSLGIPDKDSYTISQERVFAEVLLDGEVDLLQHTTSNLSENFYLRLRDTIVRLNYKRFQLYEDGQRSLFEEKKYVGELRYYLRDCPDIPVDHIGYTKTDMIDVVKFYSDCIGVDYLVIQPQEEGSRATKTTKVNQKRERASEVSIMAGLSASQINFTGSFVKEYLTELDIPVHLGPTAGISVAYYLSRTREDILLHNELVFTTLSISGQYRKDISDTEYTITDTEFSMLSLHLRCLLTYEFLGDGKFGLAIQLGPGFNLNAGTSKNYRNWTLFAGGSQSQNGNFAVDRVIPGEVTPVIGTRLSYQKIGLYLRYEPVKAVSNESDLKSKGNRFGALLSYKF